ncbi:uncharacterized protein BJ212DRAFT_1448833 [Suillus subaureus]|uniref:Uncharacterized protein n=1 Tax=Suillus subaureus TaxID=48587 RepID=A0A9P7J929_9AGAM|nr:uncharacterized protein BJ212DRAFT_1448833 [Suillus subaureus]KAG1809074.1 hypothetical protein BJ212DRAFT_1448833 [Suillus subaureus]
MQTANQKSNMFQSIFSIFLQSAHTPQKVIKMLSWMGICVSIDSINTTILSLSKEAHHGISALGWTLLASYAYNNFDVDLKSTVHTHGIALENLYCSEALWERSLLNPEVDSMDILSDLIKYGPTYFHQFKDHLHLESVEMIPVTKTNILASQVMDISNSMVSGDINSVLELLKQGDIEDPAECDPLQGLDVSDDLGTGKCLQVALQ